ncbi:phage terminase small subunit P27 family [Leuconostoc citreum]|uniref:phage terminase small subunit P27 family n=1 Tax=Leuconostoc citreum TaxID=33964 RepID=UPI00200B033F|nr:phage terminase small subunit P27 family [Leuconostoc citreum]MCK8606158.1 phage terminase small subunit P27 family [Leuconostoc citreum]
MKGKNELQPTAPRYLKGQARTMYETLVPLLTERGTQGISQSIVEQYCQTWQISRLAFDTIQTEGIVDDNGKKSGAVTTYEAATKNLRALANDLGLSPQSMVNLQKLMLDTEDQDEQGMSFKERADKMQF